MRELGQRGERSGSRHLADSPEVVTSDSPGRVRPSGVRNPRVAPPAAQQARQYDAIAPDYSLGKLGGVPRDEGDYPCATLTRLDWAPKRSHPAQRLHGHESLCLCARAVVRLSQGAGVRDRRTASRNPGPSTTAFRSASGQATCRPRRKRRVISATWQPRRWLDLQTRHGPGQTQRMGARVLVWVHRGRLMSVLWSFGPGIAKLILRPKRTALRGSARLSGFLLCPR